MTSDRGKNCSEAGADCTFAALSGTVFTENTAFFAGGAIFASDFDAIRLDCSQQSEAEIQESNKGSLQ